MPLPESDAEPEARPHPRRGRDPTSERANGSGIGPSDGSGRPPHSHPRSPRPGSGRAQHCPQEGVVCGTHHTERLLQRGDLQLHPQGAPVRPAWGAGREACDRPSSPRHSRREAPENLSKGPSVRCPGVLPAAARGQQGTQTPTPRNVPRATSHLCERSGRFCLVQGVELFLKKTVLVFGFFGLPPHTHTHNTSFPAKSRPSAVRFIQW